MLRHFENLALTGRPFYVDLDSEVLASFSRYPTPSEIEGPPVEQDPLSPINKLDDDCLRLIFGYLPIFDKVRIELVCKKWKRLSRESWYSFKTLDLSPQTWGWSQRSRIRIIGNKIFDRVLQRCGQYLQTVDLSIKNYSFPDQGYFNSMNVETIELICESCPNLKALNLAEVYIDPTKNLSRLSPKRRYMFLNTFKQDINCEHAGFLECAVASCLFQLVDVVDLQFPDDDYEIGKKLTHEVMQTLIAHCHNFTKFCMGVESSTDFVNDVVALFQNMKNIKQIKLRRIPGACLAHLSFDTIEELFVGQCTDDHQEQLYTLIKKCQKLNTLVLDTSDSLDDSRMQVISSKAAGLKNLGLIYPYKVSITGMKNIHRFHNLEKLNVKDSTIVDDQFLESLAVNCEELVLLDISGCYKVTNNGVLSISTLPQLQYLTIAGLHHVTDRFLSRFHSLKVLNCKSCWRIGDEGTSILIERASQLSVLILDECEHITENLLDVAVRVVKERSNNIILNIGLGYKVRFDIEKYANASPLLRISDKIYKIKSRKMDFKDQYFLVEDNYQISDSSKFVEYQKKNPFRRNKCDFF